MEGTSRHPPERSDESQDATRAAKLTTPGTPAIARGSADGEGSAI